MARSTLEVLGASVSMGFETFGTGRPILLLHGGAGPASMRPLADAFPDRRTILPTHPGFDRTDRPDWLKSIDDLSICYLAFIDALSLRDVLLVGNSAGGWIAADMAIRRPGAVAGIVLIDTVGLAPSATTGPIIDPSRMSPAELVKLSFADPRKATSLGASPEQVGENQRVLQSYAGDPFMHDPSLAARLPEITVPAHVIWGEKDGIVTTAYGATFADLIPGATFQVIGDAGHFPQLEQLDEVAGIIRHGSLADGVLARSDIRQGSHAKSFQGNDDAAPS